MKLIGDLMLKQALMKPIESNSAELICINIDGLDFDIPRGSLPAVMEIIKGSTKKQKGELSQNQTILNHLKDSGSITSMAAISKCTLD